MSDLYPESNSSYWEQRWEEAEAETRRLRTSVKMLGAALEALLQGSKIRVYGCAYTTETGVRRSSIALTEEQRKLIEALEDL